MRAEVLSSVDPGLWPQLALVIFVGVFVGALVWIIRPGAGAIYRERSRMPLDDDLAPSAGGERHVQGN